MRKFFFTLLGVATLVGITATAVHFGDRKLFVPPPDAVSEGFARELITKRWDRARAYLAEPESVSQEQLEEIAAKLGDPMVIEAETVQENERDALAIVRVSSGNVSEAVSFALTFDAEWKITLAPRDRARRDAIRAAL